MQRRNLLIHASAGLLGFGTYGLATAQSVTASPVAPATTSTPALGRSLPAHAEPALPGGIFSGTARMRFFAFDVYDASLWVAPGFKAAQYAQSALVLELAYLRALNGHSIAERSITEMRRSGDIGAAQEQRWLTAMEASFADVKSGDRITGMHNPASGARFWFNGTARAPILDPEFSRLFFGIWLSASTSEPKLRSALLANAPA